MTEKDESPSPVDRDKVIGDKNIITGDFINSHDITIQMFPSAEKKPPREPDALPPAGVLPEPKAAFPNWYLPIPRNAVFTGREADLLALADALLYHPQAGVTAISAVKGEGGIGKSQLAVEFAYRYGRFFYGVHWIPAGENQDIGAGIAVCGEKMGLPYWPEKLPEQVEATLRAWAESPLRLVVLDNLEDPERLREWLPRLGMCCLLITTRRGSWPEELGVRDHVLDTLSLPEARDLLRKLAKRLKKTPDEDLYSLAKQLGCLPLALDLAGRYLDECKNISVGAYLEEIQSGGAIKHESLVDWTKKTPTLHAPSIAATFALSWNQLDEASRYDALAKHIFFAAGYCAPNTPIPLWLMQSAVAEEKDSTIARALRRLTDLGLMRESENGPSLHPLLGEFARLVEPPDSGALAGVVKTLLEASYAVEGNRSTKDWQPFRVHLEAAAAYKEGIGLEHASRLLFEVGQCLYTYGEYSRARERYEQSLAIFQELGDRSGVANSLHQLGGLHRQQGEYPQAHERYEQSLAIFQELGDRSGVATSLHQLGSLHYLQGEYPQARELTEQSLAIFQELGDRSGVASSLHQLGSLHQLQGEYPQARELTEQSLAIKQELGDRSGVASSLHQLGNLHYLQGEYPQAHERYEQSLAIDQELGNRSGMAISLYQLGTLHQDQGEYPQARELTEQSLAIFQELGDRSGVAASLHQVGRLYQEQGEYPQARELTEQSLAIFQEMGDRSGVAASLYQLGILHQQQGEYPQARVRYEQSLAIAQELGDRSGMAKSLYQLGMLHQQQGEYPQARELTEQSLAITQELGDRSGVAASLHQLGSLHYLQGEYRQARERYEQSLALKQELGDRSGMAADLHQLGMLHQQQGEYPQAREFTEQSLAIFQELGDRSGMAKSLHQLGSLHYLQGEYPQARELTEQSLAIFQELGDRSGVATGLAQMGVLAEQEGQPALAVAWMLQALTIFDQLGMPQRQQVRGYLMQLKGKMGDAAFAEAVAAVEGEGTVPDLAEDEEGISMDQLVKVVVITTVAVMTSMPEKKGDWENTLEQIQAGAAQQEMKDLAVFLDLVRQLLEGASPERLTGRVPQDFLAAWEAILAGISKG